MVRQMLCECMSMACEMPWDKLLFGNGHNPQCEHFQMSDLWLYQVDCGEIDTVLANSFAEAITLASDGGCNTDMDGLSEEVTIRRIPVDKILSGVFDCDGKRVRFVDEILKDKTPRLICSTCY